MGFNNLEAPFADAEIRWAINYAIDRQQLVEVGWQGAGTYSLLPFPDFPPLRRFTGQIEDLLDRYPVGTHDPAKTAEIMQRRGWVLEKDIWTKEGTPFKITIDLHPNLHDIVPVLVEQLRRAGFDAGFRMTSDYYTRMTVGDARAFLIGNAGSVRDPYFTLRLYHSRYVQPTGTAAIYFWRWQNDHFDQIINRMAGTAPDDPQLLEHFRQAMEIWLRELPSIPLLQWYHRIPHNETYWQNWPTAETPYINSAYWARTWLLVLLELEPVQ